ncbi:MAG: GNAT family N-acetyltransferase [Anaerolineales bacterium]|nr:GNAT family N-acetyltransferase [Anaerolineales bacterium]
MVTLGLQVRPAVIADQQQISNLILSESDVHRHLDWRAPVDWLGSKYYWVLEDARRIIAALACPQDPPGIAWLRLFVHASPLSGSEAWSPLWEAVCAEIQAQGGATIGVISLYGWLQNILLENNFQFKQNIVMLEWFNQSVELSPLPADVTIRKMTADDLDQTVETDASAFAPLWRNSYIALQKALSLALFATVAERDRQIIGYQISTPNSLGAHLARLTVRKETQGQGIGRALLTELLIQVRKRRLGRLTVNTQDDNAISLALYQKSGFLRTGEQFPVFVYEI